MKTGKTHMLLTAAMVAGVMCTASAQTETKKQATVHIKKIENVNGVEKVTDTTYTTSDPHMVISEDGHEIQISEEAADAKGTKKIVIVTDAEHAGDDMSAEEKEKIHKMLSEMDVDPARANVQKTVIVHDETSSDGKKEHTIRKSISVKIHITDADETDKQRLGDQVGSADNKLSVDQMVFYPNPNSGKFNLKFSLKDKGDASVMIYNTSGKAIYTEQLPGFSGQYDKPIDISGNDKGVYFVKIMQGRHAQVKKIVLE